VPDSLFGFKTVTQCPGVPSTVLLPRNTWSDPAAYDAASQKLTGLFRKNFQNYQAHTSAEVQAAGPR
jgi:phosphoenolpyruvate carboxykinase (ATP)